MYEPLPTPLADHMTADLPIVADFTALDGTTYHKLELIIKRKQGSASVYCLERDWQQTTAAHLAYQMTLNEALIDQVNILAERSERLARELERLHGLASTSASDRDLGQLALLDTVKRFSESNRELQLERDGLRAANDELRRELSGLVPLLSVPLTQEVNEIVVLTTEMVATSLYPAGELDAIRDALEVAENENMEGVGQPEPESFACRYGCGKVSESELGRKIHEGRRHGGPFIESAPTPLAVAPDDAPFVCSQCNSSAFTRSMTHPDRCMRCASKARQSPHTFAEAA